MVKNCMRVTKLTFLGQISKGTCMPPTLGVYLQIQANCWQGNCLIFKTTERKGICTSMLNSKLGHKRE